MRKTFATTTLYYQTCTKYFPVLLCTRSLDKVLCTTKLAKKKNFPALSLHKALLSTTLYYKACRNHFPVLLCTTKLAETTSQYYFVLQSLHQYYFVLQKLHKVLPGTTLYYKTCTKQFPVLPCTTKLAKSISNSTLYYKACTKYFPVLFCTTSTTKLAQSTSQYYFVLQGLHKALPSTTLYCKTCTEHFPVLLTVSQGTSEHTSSLYTRQAFTHRIFYTKKAFTRRNFYTRLAFTHGIPRSFYTKKGLHRSTFLRRKAFTHSLQQAFTHGKLLHREAFTQKFVHREACTHREAFTHRETFTYRKLYAQQAFSHRNQAYATFIQPSDCVLQRRVTNPYVFTHMATKHGNNHAAIPLQSAITDSKTPYNYAHMSSHTLQNTLEEPKNVRTSVPATASHTSCPSSPEKQCLALRLPPQNQAHATFMQPLQCVFCSATSQTRMYLRT